MIKNYITPNDTGILAESDSSSIQNAVNEAVRRDIRKVVIPRVNERTGEPRWDIDTAIIIPSDFEMILDNCYIRQADGSADNVFRNFREGEETHTLEEESHDIVIRGIGAATVDGGKHNGIFEADFKKGVTKSPQINSMILLHNVKGLRIEGISFINQRYWAINLHYVEEAKLSDLTIKCDNGYHNLDGIDLRSGCNNIILENLFGQSGDDFIALTGFTGGAESERFFVEGKSIDIHDVVIKNIVATSAECTVIALRNQDGVKIYNVTVDTVHDTISSNETVNKNPSFVFGFDNNAYRSPKSPYATLRIGQKGWIKNKEIEMGEIYGIHVTNLHARTNAAIVINEKLLDSYFGGIYAGPGVERVITTKSCRASQEYGADMKNVVFENIFFTTGELADSSVAFDFDENLGSHTLENVFIRNAFVGDAATAIDMKHKGTLTVSGLFGKKGREGIVTDGSGRVILDGEVID